MFLLPLDTALYRGRMVLVFDKARPVGATTGHFAASLPTVRAWCLHCCARPFPYQDAGFASRQHFLACALIGSSARSLAFTLVGGCCRHLSRCKTRRRFSTDGGVAPPTLRPRIGCSLMELIVCAVCCRRLSRFGISRRGERMPFPGLRTVYIGRGEGHHCPDKHRCGCFSRLTEAR